MQKAFYILLSSLILLSACSVKKRTYRKGYYVDWVKQGNRNIEKPAQETTKKNTLAQKEELAQIHTEADIDLASTNNSVTKKNLSPKKLITFKDTCGDVINLRKGDIITAKVLEITETQIKYKRCNNLDGPLIVINKNDVYSIKYTNGNTDNFIKSSNIDNTNGNYVNKKEHPLVEKAVTWTALILYIGVLAAIPAYILARQAKNQILMHPNKFSGLETATRCERISGIYLLIAAIFILFVVGLVYLPFFI